MDAAQESTRTEYPVPIIEAALCTGCGLCVEACPTGTLAMNDKLAVIARPQACQYNGHCERICPTRAITRPFQFIFTTGDSSA